MALTTATLRDHGVDLYVPSLLHGRTIGDFCFGSTSALNGPAQQTTNGEVILCAKGRYKNTHGWLFLFEGVLRFCSPIRLRRRGSWEWHWTTDIADVGQ